MAREENKVNKKTPGTSGQGGGGKVPIQPGPAVYGMFPGFPYKAWAAIAELIDNSVSSFLKYEDALKKTDGSGYVLRVFIEFDEQANTLSIRDNAAGINSHEMGRAFELATPPEDLQYIGQYGIGMKAAACWFAREWEVVSSALGEDIERKIIWNTAEIVKGATTELPVTFREVSPNDHYTVLTMRDLIHPPLGKTKTKIKEYIASIFRVFIAQSKMEIYWQGDLLEVPTFPVLEAPFAENQSGDPVKWETDISIVTDDGTRIRGRAFLLETMKRTYTALNFFWHGRLIKGNFDPNFRPHDLFGAINSFESGRLCIEMHLDDFKPTIDKRDFRFDDSGASEEEIITKIQEFLMRPELPLLQQAKKYRKLEPEEEVTPDLGDVPGIIPTGETVLNDPPEPPPTHPYPSPPAGEMPDGGHVIERDFELLVGGSPWKFTIRIASHPSDNYLLDIREVPQRNESDPEHLVMTIGYRHPFINLFMGPDTKQLILNFCIALGFAEISARRAGQEMASFVRSNMDIFLRTLAERQVAGES